MFLRWLYSRLPQGTRSLKSVLAFYFIPISIIPVVVISLYATREFERNTHNMLINRAASEKDALVSEIDALESRHFEAARTHATRTRLIRAVERKDRGAVRKAIRSFQKKFDVRVYTRNGKYLAGRQVRKGAKQIPYISKDGLKKLRRWGETMQRYYATVGDGFVTTIRHYLRNGRRQIVGILEEEYFFGSEELRLLKGQREVDALILKPDFTVVTGSFPISTKNLKPLTNSLFQTKLGKNRPIFIKLGTSRYAAFLYRLPANKGTRKDWGYLAVFLSMGQLDQILGRLKLYLIYLTALLVLFTLLLVLLVSRRLVKPIEVLVGGMKRIKSRRLEQIPEIDSTHEIEYLVSSFNDMARNIHASNEALELRLLELRRANEDIKNAQATMVQSAKMASLGQIVAGVAHELNNPIAFIYSNMHHLLEYVDNIKKMVAEYDELKTKLPKAEQAKLKKLYKELDIEFILKDMEDLTRSCVDGANRTKEIVLGLRTFSRIEDSSFGVADLNEGLKNTMKLLITQFKDRVTVHEEYGKIPHIECNLSQLNQVFMNLISNAAHAIPHRGELWIRTYAKGKTVCVEIEDSGSGMTSDMLVKIFDPFFTTKKVGSGTGLGLSIAYGLIQKHNGTITVQSQVNKGTRFTISLPIEQPESLVG